jgi:hypothetical protein
MGFPTPVMDHHGFVVKEVLAVQCDCFYFGTGDFKAREETEGGD